MTKAGQGLADGSAPDASDADSYAVVRNHEGRHSVWLEAREIPAGWERTGFAGDRGSCLAEISRVWTDIYPVSVRL
jgi:MbtH protein